MLSVDELTSVDALDALRPDWEALWRAATTATPFQSPAWVLPWWRHFGQGAPLVLAVRDRRALVGVAAFYTTYDDAQRRGRLLLIGTGNTDHLDVLLAYGYERAVADAVLMHLASRGGEWIACDLQQLCATSPLLVAEVPAGTRAEITTGEPCPTLSLPDSPDALVAQLPRGFRRRFAYQRRRAEKAGPLRVTAAVDSASLTALLDALFALHAMRWRARGERGVLDDPVVQSFHREAAARLMSLGVLRCYGLHLGDRDVGVYYGFGDGRRAYYYIGGFDPEFATLSPGALAVGHAMEEAVREGAGEFDFLRGREAYKYEWGATDRPSYRRVLRLRPASVS